MSFASNANDIVLQQRIHKQRVIDASVGGAKLSSRTITNRFNFCRKVCMISMDDKYRSRETIGGYGVHRILKHEL